MTPNLKKLLLLNAPYLFFVYPFDKLSQAFRFSPGINLSGKLLSIGQGFAAAFASAAPSVHPRDLLVGIVGAIIVRLAVYMKGKNAKKYRKGVEYGSARWGNAEDIKPYIDPVFQNNVLLTQTERLTISSRPKQPKYARNKNVLVIGGSGSGKTRFFVKPNLMQMHSSYCITDPKGTILVECGRLLQRGGYRIKVLNACDAGREGELIFRFVYEMADCDKPMRRLWISSMEREAIRQGFSDLKDGKTYENLYASALCRAKADWIIGINATRLFSCLYGKTLNVGRVQTPTLKMLVDVDRIGFQTVPEFLQQPLVPDEHLTGEQVKTLRGNFYVTDMTQEQMKAAGYGYHHQSEDGMYHIMGNGTTAFAVAVQPENYLKAAEQTTEQNENMIDGVINNTPTVDELEAKAKAGETISLVDLANAIKADKERSDKKEKKPSIRAQLKAAQEEQKKRKPAKTKTHELEV